MSGVCLSGVHEERPVEAPGRIWETRVDYLALNYDLVGR